MKRLESNFQNMVLSLTVITLVAAAALGGIFKLTEGPIKEAADKKQAEAIYSVLPQIEGITIADAVTTANGSVVRKAYLDSTLIGAAVETSETGFGGKIKLMVGFDTEGNIVGYEVLSQAETPGLGTHIVEWFKEKSSILGINPSKVNFTVSKDGGDVDAITAATISSRAFLKAVNAAYVAFISPAEADALTSATAVTVAVSDSVAVLSADSAVLSVDTLQTVENHE